MMKLFAQITKVDEAKRLVIGRAVQEVPDRVDEIFDYAKSKPYFEEWSKSWSEDTDGKSLGNLRAMHGKIAAGKLTNIDFNDADLAIDIEAKVVDDNEWEKVIAGVYRGFSIGGSYVGEKIAEKVDGKEFKRYTAKPIEISLVDTPCIPTAKFFDVVKSDGATLQKEFKESAPATPEDAGAAAGGAAAPVALAEKTEGTELEVTGTDGEVAEFAKAMNDSGLTMADAIDAIKGAAAAKASPAPTAEQRLADAVVVLKGMYNVQSFAECLSCISNIAADATFDARWEGDDSPVPAALREWLAAGVAIFQAMASEETAEMLAALREAAGEDLDSVIEAAAHVADLKKRLADPELTFPDLYALAVAELGDDGVKALKAAQIGELSKAVLDKAASKVDAARVQEIHDHATGMGASCASKAEPTGDLTKAAPEIEKVQGDLAKALQRIEQLEKQPLPTRVALLTKTVTKAQENAGDAGVDDAALAKQFIVRQADGSVDVATTMIKVQQAFGGKPAPFAQPADAQP